MTEKIERTIELEIRVTAIMREIGIPAHINGYNYIREAIILCLGDGELLQKVTKRLYPELGEVFQTTSSRVERGIRHAIEVAWDRGNVEILNKYFGYTISSRKGKPSNSEFIAMIVDTIYLEIKKNN